ncbi:MAG TPA: hypothetical protein VJM10_03100, partial [Candidatus Methylomirabilis sp.]|nr:hypothetical protein [Candidatus Methylomirabilis sp.]
AACCARLRVRVLVGQGKFASTGLSAGFDKAQDGPASTGLSAGPSTQLRLRTEPAEVTGPAPTMGVIRYMWLGMTPHAANKTDVSGVERTIPGYPH